ncbi:MAG: hypothetical protein OJF47_000847 [Nitrospira sp.]|jgi:transmembrane sensor|nr:MAG: hypothetical protein OJF47_000847 [Nitrospira sp.]
MVRLRSGEADDADREQFDIWLAKDPTHRQEFDRLVAMWNTLDRAKPLLERDLLEAEAVYHSASRSSALSFWFRQGGPGRRLMTVGALAALLILVTSWWWTWPSEAVRYHTAKGEQRHVTLADGSSVMLNTASEIIAQFSNKERLVVLDHGEAWFEVRHDEKRPFRVLGANGAVLDIGTQFIVNKSSEKVMVSVLEGTVEVHVPAVPESPMAVRPARVHQGEQVWYDATGRVSSIDSFNRSMVGAWREGKLVFQTLPLEHVLAEMARYRPEDIRVLDPELKNIPVSGVFNIRDLQHFVQALQDALPIRAIWVNPQLIIIEPKSATTTHRKS